MSAIDWKKDESVAVITMNDGENRHHPGFVNAFLEVLDDIEKDSSVSSVVVLSGDPKNWSQGIDLNWVMDRRQANDLQAIKDFMYGINQVFRRILLYPMPVIACINGHAAANGAILACACDFRFMRSDRGFFFFPEIDIGIPFLPGMIAFLKKAIPCQKFEEMTFTGRRYGASELEPHQILKACENEEVLIRETLAFAKSLNKKRGVFGEMKKRLHKSIVEIIDKEDPPFMEPVFLIGNN